MNAQVLLLPSTPASAQVCIENQHRIPLNLVPSSHCPADGLAPGFQSRLRVRLRPVGSQPGSSEERVLYPRLIVGADGFRSVVRDTLASWDKQRGKAGGRGRFEMLQFSSPAADLRQVGLKGASVSAGSMKQSHG
jgi:hypothetical protein